MEPFEMDKIIREKLQLKSDVYRKELDEAKPFVWSAIQQQINVKHSPTWTHLAAAILVLFISFTFIIIKFNQRHKAEIIALVEKVDLMQREHQSEKAALQSKITQMSEMTDHLLLAESKLTKVVQANPGIQKDVIIYRTDTVYIKQVEYITTSDQPLRTPEPAVEAAANDPQLLVTQVRENKKEDIIFPAERIRSEAQDSETIKLKFAAFTAGKN
jgi:hypothetical protein